LHNRFIPHAGMVEAMTLGKAFVALAFLALLPAGSAEAEDAEPAAGAAQCMAGLAAPPCGYIVPQLALDFPDKPACKAATLGAQVDLSTCLALPAKGESIVQQGVMRWYWDITQDGTYPADPMEPIVIQFTGTATNPSWLDLKVEPESFTLDAAALASPLNMKTNTENPTAPQVWFWYEQPITVTLTRTGDPTEENLGKIAGSGGVQKVFLKAKSNASGAYFKEAFGVEEFRFNAYSDEAIATSAGGDSKGSPGLGPLALAGVLALALLAFRRRA
jgi:hypothetical protein